MIIIKENFRQEIKRIKNTRDKIHQLRHEHLTQCQREAELVENKTRDQFIKILLIIERQRETHRFVRSLSKPTNTSGIKNIDIPKDNSVDWNNIPKYISRVSGKGNYTSENKIMHHRTEWITFASNPRNSIHHSTTRYKQFHTV